MWTFLRAVLAAVFLILMAVVFILHSQGNINVTSILSFIDIIVLGLLACSCFVAAYLVGVVPLNLLRWIAIFADGLIRFCMPTYCRESPVHHEETLQRTDGTRDMASIAPDSFIRSLNRRQRSLSEDIRRSNAYDALNVHPLPVPRTFEQSSTLMERVFCSEYIYLLMWLHRILDLSFPPETERQKLPRSQSDSLLQPNVRTRLPVLLNRNRTHNEDAMTNESLYSPQRGTPGPSGKQQVIVVKSEEAHLRQIESRVHRRSLSRRKCASTTKERIDPQPWVLSESRTRQRQTEWNDFNPTPIFCVRSRYESPRIVSEQLNGLQVQRRESLATRERETGVNLSGQISDILSIIGCRLSLRVLSGSRTRQRQTESNIFNPTHPFYVISRDESPEIVSEQLHGSQIQSERPTTQVQEMLLSLLLDPRVGDRLLWDPLQRLLHEISRIQSENESNVDYQTPLVSVEFRGELPEMASEQLRGLQVQRRENLATRERETGVNLFVQITDIQSNIGCRLRLRVLSGSRTHLFCVISIDESPEIVSEQLHGSQIQSERPTTQVQEMLLSLLWDPQVGDRLLWDLLSSLLHELSRTQSENESNIDYRTPLVSVEFRGELPEMASEQLRRLQVQRRESLATRERETGVNLSVQITDIQSNIGCRLRLRVLSGSRTRQRQTESNVIYPTPLCVISRDESPEIVSEQLRGSQIQRERPITQVQEILLALLWDPRVGDRLLWDLFLTTLEQSGVHLPRQMPDILRNIDRRLRQRRSSAEESCQGKKNNKTP